MEDGSHGGQRGREGSSGGRQEAIGVGATYYEPLPTWPARPAKTSSRPPPSTSFARRSRPFATLRPPPPGATHFLHLQLQPTFVRPPSISLFSADNTISPRPDDGQCTMRAYAPAQNASARPCPAFARERTRSGSLRLPPWGPPPLSRCHRPPLSRTHARSHLQLAAALAPICMRSQDSYRHSPSTDKFSRMTFSPPFRRSSSVLNPRHPSAFCWCCCSSECVNECFKQSARMSSSP